MRIVEYSEKFAAEVQTLILDIQRGEFGLNITIDDQPDLKIIASFYQKGYGNFWVAVNDDKVVGTIALIDIGSKDAALRKMFIAEEHRGKDKAVAQQLLNTLLQWGKTNELHSIYLGTVNTMKAAHRFYERNGFVEINKQQLPDSFPRMRLDNVFYQYAFN